METVNTKTKDTLGDLIIWPARRSGKTTRQVDYAIQLLFEGYKVKCKDHWYGGAERKLNKDLFDRIVNRLNNEHEFALKTRLDMILDHEECTIQLVKNYEKIN